MSLFFTADTHFGHANIIKYTNRPFLAELDKKALEKRGGKWKDRDKWKISIDSLQMMNSTMIENINKIVGKNDTLWHLGDFAFGRTHYVNDCLNYRNKIRCKNVNIIWGNHDKPHLIKHLFKSDAYLIPRYKWNKQTFFLTHYAPAVWDKSHRGSIALYGHSHANAEKRLDKIMPDRRSMDVGVDNAYRLTGEYRPFSFEEIISIMNKKKGCYIDHHE